MLLKRAEKLKIASAFTMMEVCVALGVATLVYGSIIVAYIQSSYQAEWAGYSLAASALTMQGLEQARSAKWDVLDTPVVDEITNLPSITSNRLDLPISGTNVTWATNFTAVSTITIATNPDVVIHMVKVDVKWPYIRKGQKIWFTNSVANYYAPDR